MTVAINAITAADLPAVGRFLHTQLNRRVPAVAWERAARPPWQAFAPNHGFLLRDGEVIVGAYLAFYSERIIDGRPERFCNLGAWCVLPDYRFHAPRLLKALLAQDGFHFTDLSPSGNVPAINTRLGFRDLDTATALVPNLPWPTWPSRRRISSAPAVVEQHVAGHDRVLYQDHAEAAAARHVILVDGKRSCYVIFRRDRRKGLPLFASILYVSDPVVLHDMARQFSRHLLLRHGVLVTLVESRLIGRPPRWSFALAAPRPKMFKSERLTADKIDNLYSELVCVRW